MYAYTYAFVQLLVLVEHNDQQAEYIWSLNFIFLNVTQVIIQTFQ